MFPLEEAGCIEQHCAHRIGQRRLRSVALVAIPTAAKVPCVWRRRVADAEGGQTGRRVLKGWCSGAGSVPRTNKTSTMPFVSFQISGRRSKWTRPRGGANLLRPY
jgi:hypothetical protein